MGFDAWLEAGADARLHITTNHGDLDLALNDIGIDDHQLDAGGLNRRLGVFRLPDARLERDMAETRRIRINQSGDNPIWISVTTEDGYQAWSSPIYVFR